MAFSKKETILALDCSGSGVFLALLDDGNAVASHTESLPTPHSLSLLKSLSDFIAASQRSLDEITGVLFAVGPGSFTSLRVGLATLQGLFTGRDGFMTMTCSSLLLRCLSERSRNGGDVDVLMPAGRGRFYKGTLKGDNFSESLVNHIAAETSCEVAVASESFTAVLARESWCRVTSLNELRLNYIAQADVGGAVR